MKRTFIGIAIAFVVGILTIIALKGYPLDCGTYNMLW